MNPLKSKKAIWWSVGLFAVLIAVFFAAVIMPHSGEPYGSDAPDVRVPNMQNAPDRPGTHHLDLEVTDEEPKKE